VPIRPTPRPLPSSPAAMGPTSSTQAQRDLPKDMNRNAVTLEQGRRVAGHQGGCGQVAASLLAAPLHGWTKAIKISVYKNMADIDISILERCIMRNVPIRREVSHG